MKKLVFIIMILEVIMLFFGCNGKMSGMPKYINEECYYGEGSQDYTDYCKYFYNEDTIKKFETHTKFKKVRDSDIKSIRSYFEDFDEWVKNETYFEKYDFDYQSQIKEGDYVYIFTKEGYDKFEYYDVYYVDMSKNILYFIHSNT